MRFNINLVTRTYLNHGLINRWFTFLILLLVTLLAANIFRTARGAAELYSLSAQVAEIEAGAAKRPQGVSEEEFKRITGKITFYNSIIRKKSYNWLEVLDQLEQVTPEGVAISLLKPEQKIQQLKIEGRAKNFKLVQKYLEQLTDSHFFTSVLLQSHRSEKNNESGTGLEFVITCKVALP